MRSIMHRQKPKQKQSSLIRQQRGLVAYTDGLTAEGIVKAACLQDGWSILLERAKTLRGEIDLVVRKDKIICFIEVKKRKTLTAAAECLTQKQQTRLYQAAECLLAQHPEWIYDELRFDLFMIDQQQEIAWIKDIIRQM